MGYEQQLSYERFTLVKELIPRLDELAPGQQLEITGTANYITKVRGALYSLFSIQKRQGEFKITRPTMELLICMKKEVLEKRNLTVTTETKDKISPKLHQLISFLLTLSEQDALEHCRSSSFPARERLIAMSEYDRIKGLGKGLR